MEEHQIGDVVVESVRSEIRKRIADATDMRNAAESMATRASRESGKAWLDVYAEYGLSDKYDYSMNHETGAVTVIGRSYRGRF